MDWIGQTIEIQGEIWKVIKCRDFDPAEKSLVKRAEVVPSLLGKSICFFMQSGGQTFIPLLDESPLLPGDTIDMNKIQLFTLQKDDAFHHYQDEITRVYAW